LAAKRKGTRNENRSKEEQGLTDSVSVLTS